MSMSSQGDGGAGGGGIGTGSRLERESSTPLRTVKVTTAQILLLT